MTIAQVILTDHAVILRTPYSQEFVADLKLEIDWRARKWNAAMKTWEIDKLYKDIAIAVCRRWYTQVVIDDQTTKRQSPPKQQAITADGWAEALFSATPDHLHRDLYRALSKVLHPDAGGDAQAMKTLNAANDRRPR